MPTSLETAVAERNTAVSQLKSAVAQRDRAVVEHKAAVAARDSAVNHSKLLHGERDAARSGRDKAETERGKAVAALKGQTDLAKQHKAEGDALKVDARKKIDEGQKSGLRQKKLFDKAKTVQMAAQNEAEVATLDLAASEAERAVVDEALVAKTQEADEMRDAYAAHQVSAKAAIATLETKIRERDGRIGDLVRAAAAVPA